MKKYTDIARYGKSATYHMLNSVRTILIQEKLDGANASFERVGDEIVCYSRRTKLDESNTLRGFTDWVKNNIDVYDLEEGGIYFGEWLVRHKLDYGDNENKFYLFDVYDKKTEEYLSFDILELIAETLEIDLVPVLYYGNFVSLEHIMSFVGKSKLGEIGEGVVVKSYRYKDKYGKQVFAKFVSDEFAEKQKTKKHNVNTKKDSLQEFVDSTVTKARVSKMLHKLVDEGVLNEDFAVEDMGLILKNIGGRIFEDVVKEELDELLKTLRKRIGKSVPDIVKEVLADENRM